MLINFFKKSPDKILYEKISSLIKVNCNLIKLNVNQDGRAIYTIEQLDISKPIFAIVAKGKQYVSWDQYYPAIVYLVLDNKDISFKLENEKLAEKIYNLCKKLEKINRLKFLEENLASLDKI